ncbi:uroporphyrinogen-III C-methyltransferase [Thermostichus vulcanus]|uniref:uroporphyrinogen-III C-methyltransferase n=1 Tax=Thermostichus vulcanus str. 'Rupite' TaxID=2813851 RepID=A0ABT0C6U3_THEVL|nr:uroporphyrinogen-III C-methyltransferase [Thermostichus vulcanus]MCJ2541513.1 uroporphyrinogen-III C-methyltransferase [Thermostichus vulcanus str. 'Rupite']
MGKVYLVGAGPGDPGLLTVKGKALLAHADVVIYDALVGGPILDLIPASAERIYAGKNRGAHTLPQEQITALLIEKAQTAAVVVRLKGGDPFVFGRGGEEMLALVQAGIAVEVVPGITAGIAASAYAGIPLTHREFSSSVAFVTGHEAAGKYRPEVNWRALATAVETLVVYMGMHNLSHIVAELLAGGKAPDTPVALIRWGTTPQQEIHLYRLDQLQRQPPDVAPPTVVVIGAVVNLAMVLPHFSPLGL